LENPDQEKNKPSSLQPAAGWENVFESRTGSRWFMLRKNRIWMSSRKEPRTE
jgi:hypothetical protein